MDYVEALNQLNEHAHIRRFVELCSDDNADEVQRTAYRLLVVRLAEGGPSLVRKAVNFVAAATEFVKSGFSVSDDALFTQRMDICTQCELFNNGVCTHQSCGCNMQVKTRIRSSKCPIGRWIIILPLLFFIG